MEEVQEGLSAEAPVAGGAGARVVARVGEPGVAGVVGKAVEREEGATAMGVAERGSAEKAKGVEERVVVARVRAEVARARGMVVVG
jgi:hypothetical protein